MLQNHSDEQGVQWGTSAQLPPCTSHLTSHCLRSVDPIDLSMAALPVSESTTLEFPALNAAERQLRVTTVESNEHGHNLCETTVISLEQPVVYTALSYVWGSEPPTCAIGVDGHLF